MPPKTKALKKVRRKFDPLRSLKAAKDHLPRNDLGMLWPKMLVCDFKSHGVFQLDHTQGTRRLFTPGLYQNFISFLGCWQSGVGCHMLTSGAFRTNLPAWVSAGGAGLTAPTDCYPVGLDRLMGPGLPYARCLVVRARGKIDITTRYGSTTPGFTFGGVPSIHYCRASDAQSFQGVDATGMNIAVSQPFVDELWCQKGVKSKWVDSCVSYCDPAPTGPNNIPVVRPATRVSWKFDEYPHRLLRKRFRDYFSTKRSTNYSAWHDSTTVLGVTNATGIMIGGFQCDGIAEKDNEGWFNFSMTQTMVLDTSTGTVT